MVKKVVNNFSDELKFDIKSTDILGDIYLNPALRSASRLFRA
jgi:hypothetical protein